MKQTRFGLVFFRGRSLWALFSVKKKTSLKIVIGNVGKCSMILVCLLLYKSDFDNAKMPTATGSV